MEYKVIIDETEVTFRKATFQDLKGYEMKVLNDGLATDKIYADKYLIEETYVSGDDRITDLDNNANLIWKIKDNADFKPIERYPSTITKLDDDKFEISVIVDENITYKGIFNSLKDFKSLCDYMMVADKNMIDGDTILIRSTFLEGDEEIKNYTKYPFIYYSYRHYLHNLIGLYLEEVKKK